MANRSFVRMHRVLTDVGDAIERVGTLRLAVPLIATGSTAAGGGASNLETLREAAETLRSTVEEANRGLDEATAKLDHLRNGSVGRQDSAVAQLQQQLATARDDLQYLQDTRAGSSAIDRQQAAVDALEAQLAESQRLQRIAQHEFERSDEFRRQQAEIADRRKRLEEDERRLAEAERQQQAEEEKAREELAAEGQRVVDTVTNVFRLMSTASNETLAQVATVAGQIGSAAEQVAAANEQLVAVNEEMIRALTGNDLLAEQIRDMAVALQSGQGQGERVALSGDTLLDGIAELSRRIAELQANPQAGGGQQAFALMREMNRNIGLLRRFFRPARAFDFIDYRRRSGSPTGGTRSGQSTGRF